MSSRIPPKYVCRGSISYLVSNSIRGNLFGASPYTLFVEVKMKTAELAYKRAASRRFMVPTALISKSVNGSRAAQSWEGWAAVWMINWRSRPN